MRVVGGRAGGRRHRPKGGAADTLTRACCGVRAFEVRCHEAKGQTFQRAWTEAREMDGRRSLELGSLPLLTT